MVQTLFIFQGVPMLNIELEILLATERRNDRICEASYYRLTKSAQTEQGQRAGLSIALASRSYVILLQAVTRFLPFNAHLRNGQQR